MVASKRRVYILNLEPVDKALFRKWVVAGIIKDLVKKSFLNKCFLGVPGWLCPFSVRL